MLVCSINEVMMTKKAYLILENGRVFEGRPFGAFKEETAELVFTTNMTGYIETLTDPSYYGLFVIQTFPLIGNVGVIPKDFESSKVWPKGYIVRQWCRYPSNYRSEGDLDTFLKQSKIPCIEGIDTRALTRIVREYGVMNARISSSPFLTPEEKESLDAYKVKNALSAVTIPELFTHPQTGTGPRIALWDFGVKAGMWRELQNRGCEVIRVPAHYTASEILALKPDGLFLSNGPGDPAENIGVIRELAQLIKSGLPIMGICLGHQMLALAFGGQTEKMKYGHRGGNQPVVDIDENRVFITSQNHGYHVLASSLPSFARPVMYNANDESNEGVVYEGHPIFSVQFHPEACGGPLDTRFLFDRYLNMISGVSAHATR